MTKIKWLTSPQEHDYPAARSYLALLLGAKEIDEAIALFSKSEITFFKAKDIFRASKFKALRLENRHIASDLKKIKNGESLSPILLIRGDLSTNTRLTIADGYHRACAAYLLDEDVEVACQIIGPVDS